MSATLSLATRLGSALKVRGLMLATAESCTGGGIAQAVTDIPGSSVWFDCGFVAYSNASKTAMLGVPAELIDKHGAVSEEVAAAMASGALANSKAQVAVSVTGIAGPGGEVPGKPIGTVWFGFAAGGSIRTELLLFQGDRLAVRAQAIEHALKKLLALLG